MRACGELERRRYLRALLHAMNQPVTALVAYSEAAGRALDTGFPVRAQAALKELRAECRRLVVIARQLGLALGPAPEGPGTLAPNRVLEDLAHELSEAAGARVLVELGRGIGEVPGDPFALCCELHALVRGGLGLLCVSEAAVALQSRSISAGVEIEIRLQPGSPEAAPAYELPDDPFQDPLLALARSSLNEAGRRVTAELRGNSGLSFTVRLSPA